MGVASILAVWVPSNLMGSPPAPDAFGVFVSIALLLGVGFVALALFARKREEGVASESRPEDLFLSPPIGCEAAHAPKFCPRC